MNSASKLTVVDLNPLVAYFDDNIIVGDPSTYDFISLAVGSMSDVEALPLYRRTASDPSLRTLSLLSVPRNDLLTLSDEIPDTHLHQLVRAILRVGKYSLYTFSSSEDTKDVTITHAYEVRGLVSHPLYITIDTPVTRPKTTPTVISLSKTPYVNNNASLKPTTTLHQEVCEHMTDPSSKFYQGFCALVSELITVLHADPLLFVHYLGNDITAFRLWHLDPSDFGPVTDEYDIRYK